MTDREWALIEPFMPLQDRQGRPRSSDLREMMDALLYIASTGCRSRKLAKVSPPVSTVQGYFYD